MKITQLLRGLLATVLILGSSIASAGFPDDFSDVIWIDPDISSFPVTASVSANVRGSVLEIQDTKRSVWPRRFHTILGNNCCNRSLWIFIKLEGQWYASTFEFMRFSQINKNAEAVNGRQIKRAPFLRSGYEWRPAAGEVYGFMTSGMARFDLTNNNVRERSNVSLFRWEVGPTDNVDFEEVPRGSNGRPVESDGSGGETPEPDEPEVCVEPTEPEPANNTHTYNGSATGDLMVRGPIGNIDDTYTEDISISVKDDRSLTFRVDGESFSTQVATDGSFTGALTVDIQGVCEVDITVNGIINGTSATGTANGDDSCLGNSAVLTASFNATSSTAPSFLDQRSPFKPERTCSIEFSMAPIMNLLLD